MLRKPPFPPTQRGGHGGGGGGGKLSPTVPSTCFMTLSKIFPLSEPNLDLNEMEGLFVLLLEACAPSVHPHQPSSLGSRERAGAHTHLVEGL